MALQKIGALWLKTGQKGKYMSGQIELNGQTINILVFKNKKAKDIHPDYQIQMPVDDEPQQQQYYSEQGGNEAPKKQAGVDDDIPF